MAEINKRNLIDEVAVTYATNTTASNPTPLFSTGTPAKIARASMANTNLLSDDGDLFIGTGDTYTETIDGTEYTYAKVAKQHKNQLFPTLGLWGASVPDNVSNYTGYVAIGNGAKVTSAASIGGGIAIGGMSLQFPGDTEANGGLDVAIGNGARTLSYGAIALGYGSLVEKASKGVAIGGGARTFSESAIAFGCGSLVERASKGIAIGYSATVQSVSKDENCDNSIAIGQNTRVTASNAIQLGAGLNAAQNSFKVGSYQMLDLSTGEIPIERINARGGATSLALGGTSTGDNCTSYGFNSNASGRDSIAIGYGANVLFDGGIAIGKDAKLSSQSIPENCIAIGNGAEITYQSTTDNAIQLGTGTNSAGGFQVWNYQLLTAGGMIVRDRVPTLYKHRLKKDVVTGGGGGGASFDAYICEWYSNKRGLPTTQFNVMGHIVKWNTQQTISTGDSLADFEFKDDNLTVKYLGGEGTIATFTYNEIKESFGVQEI